MCTSRGPWPLQKRKKVWSKPACSPSGRAPWEGATVWAAVEEEGGDGRPGAGGREEEGAGEGGMVARGSRNGDGHVVDAGVGGAEGFHAGVEARGSGKEGVEEVGAL